MNAPRPAGALNHHVWVSRGSLFPPDARAELRARAADRAICRRYGALRAIYSTNRADSAAYRASIALTTETPQAVAAVLVEWCARRAGRGQS